MIKEKSKIVYSTDRTLHGKDNLLEVKPGILAPSAKHQICIILERKGRGGKSVSIISGLHLSQQYNEQLLKYLKTNLGTGGTIKTDTLEIQGNHRNAICFILQKIGYRPTPSGR